MSEDEYQIVPLTDLIETYGEERVDRLLKGYRAVFDSATESYLHDKAMEMEKRALARTYIAIDGGPKVIGYVTIGIKCLLVEDASRIDGKIVHKMNIDVNNSVAQSYLLGQLSQGFRRGADQGRLQRIGRRQEEGRLQDAASGLP